jgi:hypothetical protein
VQTAAEKASFYTHNPLWINYLIQQKNQQTISLAKEEPDPLPEITTATSLSIDEINEEPASPSLVSPEPTSPQESIATANPAAPKPMQEEELLFEPYHTIDYFASQGIKLAGADYERDKFGKQLKSFTEWLKVMKKVNIANTAKETDQVIVDPEIEKSATASIKTEEILTEAMAEVWVKQGNKVKATEIYRKLSLQNPSKSDYFADKIVKLNA